MKKTENRGFTLIELLVVIAIIGILAAVVLTSLSSARDSASDASAQSSLTSIRAAAEIYFSQEGTYVGVCTSDDVDRLRDAVEQQSGSSAPCAENATGWRVHTVLNSGNRFCVDSSGYAGSIDTGYTSTDLVYCDGSAF